MTRALTLTCQTIRYLSCKESPHIKASFIYFYDSPFTNDFIECLHHSLHYHAETPTQVHRLCLFLISVFIRRSSNKPESPQWNVDKELRDKDNICKHVNGKNFCFFSSWCKITGLLLKIK